jgi:hypothetical protein
MRVPGRFPSTAGIVVSAAVLLVVGVHFLDTRRAARPEPSTATPPLTGRAAKSAALKPWRTPGNAYGPDSPGEFARLLAEMKIPGDRQVSEYRPGYQHLELEKAMARAGIRRDVLDARGVAQSAMALPWVERGPGNVAGRARAIVVDPDDASHNTWYIGTAGGGVWKTTNGGTTWSWITPTFPVLSVSALVMAPSNRDILYAGTGEGFFNVDVMNGNGILKSTDRGVNWTPLAATINNPQFNNISRLLVDPSNPNLVLAATTQGRYTVTVPQRSSIMRSTDGGTSWTEVYFRADTGSGSLVKKILQLVADPTDFNILYATIDEGGIVKSVDRGLTWNTINTGITALTGRFELAVCPTDHLRLYAAAEGPSHSELYISTNGGASWSETFEAGTEPSWLGNQGWYDNAILPHPTNPNIVYVGGVNLARVTLSGTSRTTTFIGPGVHPDHHGLQVINAPGGWRILNTNDGGVAVSTLQDTGFDSKLDGMVTTQFYGADKRPGASAYAGGTQDNGTWQSPEGTTAATPWTHVIGGDGYEVSWQFDDPTKIIGGYQYNGIQRSLDGGMTWNPANVSTSPAGLIDNGAGNAPFITKIAKSNAAPDFLCAVGRRGVWRSLDFGGTWTLFSIAAANWGSITSFHSVRISRADPNVVWAGGRMDAPASGNVRIFKSTNMGSTFAAVNSYTTVNLGQISGLATHPTQPNTAYVLFSFAGRPKIVRTTDGGTTWSDITGFAGGSPSTNGFPDVAVYDLLVFSNDVNKMWAATEIGIVESLDGGATWALASNGLPNVGVWQLIESEDEVVAATHGRGIWSVTIPALIAGKTFKPLIDKVYQGPGGALTVDMNLRSVYDSTDVLMNGAIVANLPANTARQDVVVNLPIVSGGPKVVIVRGWKGGVQHTSVSKTINTFTPTAPVFVYTNDFESGGADFQASLFTIGPTPGFVGNAIQSDHPYADNTNPVIVLGKPIRVADQNATISFDEVALVEPGEPGVPWPDPFFYDYVVVEGSTDGCTWTAFQDGWDCRAYPEWETAYANNTPAPSLFRRRTINMLNAFDVDDTLLVRFRLFADAGANGWGWIIDNLDIQSAAQSGVGDAPVAALTLQPGLNPFRDRTTLAYSLPVSGRVALNVFDVNGRLVRRLVDEVQPAGHYEVAWDGSTATGERAANGMYFVHLAGAEQVVKRKVTLLR